MVAQGGISIVKLSVRGDTYFESGPYTHNHIEEVSTKEWVPPQLFTTSLRKYSGTSDSGPPE